MDKPTVFISYSSKDRKWVKDYLLFNLEKQGIPCHIDYRDFEIGVPSLINMERAVEKCEKTILVFSPNWVESEFSGFEGVMLQTESPLNLNKKILPLLLQKCELPKRLSIFTYADFSDEDEHDSQLERLITQIKKDFDLLEPEKTKFPPLDTQNINTVRLPKTGFELFGRQKELQLLNEAWESDGINVLSFVAYGGVGKSTLANKWLEKMRWDNYRGAEKVFAWSFYSQGTSEYVTSADMFINDALKWFGDKNFEKLSAWDKGKRLAKLVREQKTLLILDGLEPLQSGEDFEKGKIKDAALAELIKELAKNNSGLCVITTREEIPELNRYKERSKQVNLESISDEAGIKLLKMRRARGSENELTRAVNEFGNHALAINLLAEYLHQFPGHSVQKAFEIPDLDIPVKKGLYPRRIIEAFAKQFGRSSPEVELLSLLGLFDRPAEKDAVDAIINGAPIPGLTGLLAAEKGEAWSNLLERLRKFKLIAQKSEHRPDTLDCHPLIREHFGEKLEEENPEGWKEAHNRLYEYYKNLPKKELPDTLEEMEPLFAAVKHGCLAGRHLEAGNDVYWKRIKREDKQYISRKLGAFGSDLACLSNFFESIWDRPASGLPDPNKAVIFNWVGYALRAVGRLWEAVQPMEAALEMHIKQENWKESALDAGNLSELQLTLGNLKKALDKAEHSVTFADHSEYGFHMETNRITLANTFFQTGKTTEAESLFMEAEKRRKKSQPQYPYFYSLSGYIYCDLLISSGRHAEALKRAESTLLEFANKEYPKLSIALDHLTIGEALLIKSLQSVQYPSAEFTEKKEMLRAGNSAGLLEAGKFLNLAVDGLRESGHQEYLPLGLLARAALYRHQKNFSKSWTDLDEAREIAEYGEMKLHLVDYYLEGARNMEKQLTVDGDRLTDNPLFMIEDGEVLNLSKEEMEKKFNEFVKKAEELINKTGYHRRDEELKELKKD